MAATFLYDASSIYAYMAAERIDDLIPDADWRPILVAGLWKLNGRSSWFLDDEERAKRLPEIEERAARYGLPPVKFPGAMPADNLGLARAATFARRKGAVKPFSLGALRSIYADGLDPSTPEHLQRLALECGLDPAGVFAARGDESVKDELKAASEEAHSLGVPGVPAVVVDGEVFWGDDRLDEAAAAVRRA